jgi:PAS domain S-box-containing protein
MAIEDFRRIVESLKVAIAVADAKGEIAFCNTAFAELSGKEPRAMVGTPLTAVFAAADRKRVQQNIGRVGEGKAGSSFVEADLAGEEPRSVQVALQPALDARDKAAGVIAVLQDIGVQRETERALNLSVARLLALAETSPLAAMIENSEGEVELANEAFCRLLDLKSAPQSLSGIGAFEVLKRSPMIDAKALEKARKKPGQAASA